MCNDGDSTPGSIINRMYKGGPKQNKKGYLRGAWVYSLKWMTLPAFFVLRLKLGFDIERTKIDQPLHQYRLSVLSIQSCFFQLGVHRDHEQLTLEKTSSVDLLSQSHKLHRVGLGLNIPKAIGGISLRACHFRASFRKEYRKKTREIGRASC